LKRCFEFFSAHSLCFLMRTKSGILNSWYMVRTCTISCWSIIKERNLFDYGMYYIRYITCSWSKENEMSYLYTLCTHFVHTLSFGVCTKKCVQILFAKENKVTSCIGCVLRSIWNYISSSWDKKKWNEINLLLIYECMIFMLFIIWKEFHTIETWFEFINIVGCIVIWSPYMDWHDFYSWSSKGYEPWFLSITTSSLGCDGRPPLLQCNT
jgi:hypothetical protein